MEDSLSVAEEGQEPEGSNEEDRSGTRCTEKERKRERGHSISVEQQGAIQRDKVLSKET